MRPDACIPLPEFARRFYPTSLRLRELLATRLGAPRLVIGLGRLFGFDRYGQPGVRQTRWIKGVYQLTVDDVRGGTQFPDAIARCAWGIELHNTPEGTYWEGFPEGHVHYVPYRSMVHAETDNLLAAGRCIDADVLALSSVRVMGPCIAMGAAAAHAIDLAGDAPLRDVNADALRRRVARNLGEA